MFWGGGINKYTSKINIVQYHTSQAGSGVVTLEWGRGFGFMVFNVTFNNISVMSWQSVLLVEETRVPRENP
jgi:hypothetical protein